MDLPQNQLEPQLIRAATIRGFNCRFDTEFLSFVENKEDGTVDVLVKDLIFHRTSTIRTKYLFAADGGRSKIAQQMDLQFVKRPGGGLAWSVLIEADLPQYMETRRGNLHWVYELGTEQPEFAWIGFPRVVKPWHEWLIILFPSPGYQYSKEPSESEWLRRIGTMIGDPSVDIKIKDVAKWNVNETYAETYRKGNIFALGDAVHRHPPANVSSLADRRKGGSLMWLIAEATLKSSSRPKLTVKQGLGANTCVQDAYNLAWKIAYVLKGRNQIVSRPVYADHD